MRTSTPRLLGLGVLAAALLMTGSVVATIGANGGSDRPTPASATPSPSRTTAVAVLREWDRARAAAWRRGDLGALRRLYVSGSTVGRADRRLLAAYADRGLRVAGLRMQVASVDVRVATQERISLVVTDRLAGVTARGGAGSVALPSDGWSRRRVVLVRIGERWRVSEVSDQPRPLASTAPTSGSRKE